MNTLEIAVLAAMLLVGFSALAGLLLWLHRRTEEVWRTRLTEMESNHQGIMRTNHAEIAARLERVKGELRTEFAERMPESSTALREALARALAEGRSEQARQLSETAVTLEHRLDQLAENSERRHEAAVRRQTESARENAEGLRTRVEALESRMAHGLEALRAKMDQRLETINDKLQERLEKNIQEGFVHFRKVQEHLRAAETQLRNVGVVGNSINELNNLLKMPHLRGGFGEAQLGRLLADFLPASAFAEQHRITPGSREAVDAIVRFPNHVLPIDSKFNREPVRALFEADQPLAQAEARKQFGSAIRQQARSIREKYIHPEHGTTDLALMFLPSETLYFEVLRDTQLCDALHQLRVFPVSPNTLAITLRTVAMSISQYEFAQNLQSTLLRIRGAQESFGRFQKRFDEVGKGLDRAQEAYQTATGHLNRYANRVDRLAGESAEQPAEPAE